MLVFGVMAIVSLGAGLMLELAGWAVLAISTTPLLLVVLILIVYVQHKNHYQPSA